VRNPWDRVISHYADKVANDYGLHERLARYKVFHHKMPFDQYIAALDANFRQIRDVHVFPQKKLCFEGNTFLPSYVMRMERVAEDFEVIKDRTLRKFGFSIDLPHLNKSNSQFDRSLYTPATKSVVDRLYEKDIAFFGYSY
jgi:hypothetical protein